MNHAEHTYLNGDFCRLKDLVTPELNLADVRRHILRLHERHGRVIFRTKQKKGSPYLINVARLRELRSLDSDVAKSVEAYTTSDPSHKEPEVDAAQAHVPEQVSPNRAKDARALQTENERLRRKCERLEKALSMALEMYQQSEASL